MARTILSELRGDKGNDGAPGQRGLPGLEDVPTDPGVAELVRTPSETQAAVADAVGDGLGEWGAPGRIQMSAYVASVIQALRGSNLTVYGHSYTQEPGVKCTPGKEAHRVAGVRAGATIYSHGYGGARMAEMAWAAIGNVFKGTDRHYPLGRPGVVIVDCELNDIVTDANAGNTDYKAGFGHALRAILAAVSSSSHISAVDATPTGTWATISVPQSPGGVSRQTLSVGSTLTFNVTGPDHYLSTFVTDSALNPSGSFEIWVDGLFRESAISNGQMKAYASNIAGNGTVSYSNAVQPILGLSAGAHTIMVKFVSGTGIYVNGVYTRSATPPRIIVAKDPAVDSTVASPGGGTYASQYAALASTYHALIDSAVAGFWNAQSIDMSPGWDVDTMLGDDNLHPSDKGMQLIESRYNEAIASLWRTLV